MERNNQASYCWGLTMYTYGNEQNAHWSWLANGTKPGLTESLRDRMTEISSLHADAQFHFGKQTVAPGGAYAVGGRPFVAGAAVSGGLAAWTKVFADIRNW